ncbi:hypothetical protein Csa_019740 [Cucumis sativus]|uniref:Uncharacterized protein n=1 Tax=Cucumis sativus TaxID=3659 RepID=A0A0A0LWV7_CUCSA|nr:hypothetical protein Csa_019740 [Cucumis sativus]
MFNGVDEYLVIVEDLTKGRGFLYQNIELMCMVAGHANFLCEIRWEINADQAIAMCSHILDFGLLDFAGEARWKSLGTVLFKLENFLCCLFVFSKKWIVLRSIELDLVPPNLRLELFTKAG